MTTCTQCGVHAASPESDLCSPCLCDLRNMLSKLEISSDQLKATLWDAMRTAAANCGVSPREVSQAIANAAYAMAHNGEDGMAACVGMFAMVGMNEAIRERIEVSGLLG